MEHQVASVPQHQAGGSLHTGGGGGGGGGGDRKL